MKYEFHRGATTRQAVDNINSVFPTRVATNATIARWFKRFRSGNFDLSNELRDRPETQVDNDVLKATVESESQSAYELALIFGVSKQTILTHLAQIGKVKKLDKWVPHELNECAKRLDDSRHAFLFYLTAKSNHFSIELLPAMKNGSCTTIVGGLFIAVVGPS